MTHEQTSAFTPGPWEIESGFLITSPHSGQIANIRGAGIYYNEESNANAHLIAAAPELLSICEKIHRQDGKMLTEDYVELCAAIAKARGQA